MRLFATILLVLCLTMGIALATETALPAYTYPGNDATEAAVTAFMLEQWDRPDRFLTEEGDVGIPSPVIIRVEAQDEAHELVYGNFWFFRYKQTGDVLEMISGGEAPGIMTLEKTEDGWKVTAFDEAGDGEDYGQDIIRFSHGDTALEAQYFGSREEVLEEARIRFISAYVKANGLNITAYKDYGWDPVPLRLEEEAAEAGTIRGEIADGRYMLSVSVAAEDAGEWQADVLAQETAVVSLESAEVRDGVYTAVFAPVSDGAQTVVLRHYTGIACDQLNTFDLKVRDGKVEEVTGGSHTGSPLSAELDPYISGPWYQKDTQLMQLTLTANADNGWNLELVSPMTHGAYCYTATVYFDCELEALVFQDGAMYDLQADGTPMAEPRVTDGHGRIELIPIDSENLELALTWYADHAPEDEEIVFIRVK